MMNRIRNTRRLLGDAQLDAMQHGEDPIGDSFDRVGKIALIVFAVIALVVGIIVAVAR